MLVAETPLKVLFTFLLIIATIFTIVSMFTPGWRYSTYSNEGVITDHYGVTIKAKLQKNLGSTELEGALN
jgi:hypothetical protein